MKKKKLYWFTLVELIVVITILSVLWTISFISLQSYGSNARDSATLSDLKSVEKWLEFSLLKYGKTILPDEKVDINYSGSVYSYQWFAWIWVLNDIWVWVNAKSRANWEFFLYSTTKDLDKYQILWFLENDLSLSLWTKTYAENENLFFQNMWDEVGIVFESEVAINKIWNNIELKDSPIEYKIVTSLNSIEVWSGENLNKKINYLVEKKASCKNIKFHNPESLDWIYTIDYKWWKKEVYCDMITDGWWWTLFYANNGYEDSDIKKSYVSMRSDIFSWIDYNLTDYENIYLAWLLDYREFINGDWREVLVKNHFVENGNYWVISFWLSDTLLWALSDSVLSSTKSTNCKTLPSNDTWSLKDKNGLLYDDLSQMRVQSWKDNWWITHSSVTCNWFTDNKYAYVAFYLANSSWNTNRARSSQIIWWTWWWTNEYRYFIR